MNTICVIGIEKQDFRYAFQSTPVLRDQRINVYKVFKAHPLAINQRALHFFEGFKYRQQGFNYQRPIAWFRGANYARNGDLIINNQFRINLQNCSNELQSAVKNLKTAYHIKNIIKQIIEPIVLLALIVSLFALNALVLVTTCGAAAIFLVPMLSSVIVGATYFTGMYLTPFVTRCVSRLLKNYLVQHRVNRLWDLAMKEIQRPNPHVIDHIYPSDRLHRARLLRVAPPDRCQVYKTFLERQFQLAIQERNSELIEAFINYFNTHGGVPETIRQNPDYIYFRRRHAVLGWAHLRNML